MRHWINPSRIQVKITAITVVLVVLVLAVMTYLHLRLIAKNAESDLKEEVLNVVRQVDSSFGSLGEIEDPTMVNRELKELARIRNNIARIDIFILTPRGIVRVGTSDERFPAPDPPFSREEMDVLVRNHALATAQRIKDKEYWVVASPVHMGGVIVGAAKAWISTEYFKALLAKERRLSLWIMLATTVLLTAVLAAMFRRTVNRPIRLLSEAMNRAESGRLDTVVELPYKDEIGELGRHFNRMLARIRAGTEENRRLLDQVHRFNEELQKKVAEATDELRRRNEELVELSQTLFRTQRQLGRSEKLAAVGQLAATLAHEIGTPLHSVSGHVQLLQEEVSEDSAKRRLSIIESQIDRVTDIIRQTLSITRMPSPHRVPIRMEKIIEDVLRLVQPGLQTKAVRVETRISKGLPELSGDSSQLQEVLLNLLTNAMDAVAPGGRISVSTEVRDSGSKQLCVHVADNGIGISPEAMGKIFEPFFTTKAEGKGTGLGLAVSKQIVESLGGNLSAVSRAGEGSTFTITLPVLQEAA